MPDRPVKPTMRCIQCDYVLDGAPSNRCPECGRDFDAANPKTYLPASGLRYRLRSIRTRLLLGAMVGAGIGGLCLAFWWLMNISEWGAYGLILLNAPPLYFTPLVSTPVMRLLLLLGSTSILYAGYAAFFFSRCRRRYKIIGACIVIITHVWTWWEIMDVIAAGIAGMVSQ